MSADTFEVVIKGTAGPAFAAAFDDFTLNGTDDGFTHMVGAVPDQARLHGALAMLRDLGVELVSVTRISTPNEDREPVPRTKEH